MIRPPARLSKLRPRSFSGLILACLMLVAVPLIVPILYGAGSITQFSRQSRDIVYQAEQIARYSKVLTNETERMEHGVGLARILNDASVLETYFQSRNRFRAALQALGALPLTPSQIAMLAEVKSADARIYARVTRLVATQGEPKDLPADFAPLQQAVGAFTSSGDAQIEHEIDAMQGMVERASAISVWLAVLLVPFAFLLAAGAARLITKPIRQINAAIRTMGGGELSKPVRISGPEDLQRLGDQLEWLRISLLELERQKTTFLQHVSHELKTPLTSLREGADLLKEGIAGELTEKQQEIAAILLDNSILLQKRIEDLLNFNALQTGKAVVANRTLALRPIIDSVVRDHGLALQNKGLQLVLDCGEHEVQGDEQKLRIIVDNLLSNAIKYSPKDGAIRINVAPIGDSIRIDVVDIGAGVAAEDRERIFDPFYQGRPPPQGAAKGTGLGLAIAKEYALAHGGDVELVEQPTGTCFRVTLPASRRTVTP
jgi:two-component system, NtrC family, sensor histidine kinase GlrK